MPTGEMGHTVMSMQNGLSRERGEKGVKIRGLRELTKTSLLSQSRLKKHVLTLNSHQ